MKPKILLGAHMSISGGFDKAIERGESIGCTAIQVFTKSNRQWGAKDITSDEINRFKNRLSKSTIKQVVAHASYLINIGSHNTELNLKSFEALKTELQRCELLGIEYLILHPGSRQDSTEKACLDLITSNINKVFDVVPGKCQILIENMAGMGTSVGNKFEQLAYIISGIKDQSRIGVCFDTCHAFAAGYCFNDSSRYESMMLEFDKTVGINKLKCFHINDSSKECGSKVDRHAFLGKGKISIEGFKSLFNDERFFNVPKILETPINVDQSEYKPDLQLIISLISDQNISTIKDTSLASYI